MIPALPDIRIIILNYNGAPLLEKCLPSIKQAAKSSKYKTSVAVLDNLSTDSSLPDLAAKHPDVVVYTARENKILCSYNDYLPLIPEPVVILLNNDIRVDENFVDPLVEKFTEDPNTFMTAPRVMTFDGKSIEAARTKAGMKFGFFWANARYPGHLEEAMTPSETFSSGFGAFSREKFLALGGYDSRFYPGIYEDVDICYRAARAGYKLYYEPQSVVYHIGQASFKTAYGAKRIEIMAHRNSFLFMWKNFKGAGFWISHLFFLPLRLAFAALKGQWTLLQGFWQALTKQGVKK